MTKKYFLWVIFLCTLGLQPGYCQSEWADDIFDLSVEASEKMFEETPEGAGGNIRIRMPEAMEGILDLPFNMGTLNYTGNSVDVFYCNKKKNDSSNELFDFIWVGPDKVSLYLNVSQDLEANRNEGVEDIECNLALDNSNCNPPENCRFFYFTVFDLNDHEPEFDMQPPGTIDVDEEESPVLLFEVSGTDADLELGSVFITIDDTENFEIVQNTSFPNLYSVSLIKSLDYETLRSLPLTITLTDGNDIYNQVSPPKSYLVYIIVEDVGDQPPLWVNYPSLANIMENTPADITVFNVSAVDGDTGVNNNISYSILSLEHDGESVTSFLAVDSSGQVKTVGDIDRELYGTNSFLSLNMIAEEDSCGPVPEPCVTNVTISLKIEDMNDNDPVIACNTTNITIPENPLGILEFDVIVITDDDFEVSMSSFDIEITSDDQNAVNAIIPQPASGVQNTPVYLRVNDASDYFDFETIRLIEFKVKATDSGNASKYSDLAFSITLEDVNDNSPIFDQSEYNLTVNEDLSDIPSTNGRYELITVSATDLDDSPEFGQNSIIYEISTTLPMEIDRDTGVIYFPTSDTNLDYEANPDHHITVSAKDSNGAANSLSDIVDFHLILRNVNDEPPSIDYDPKSQIYCIYEGDETDWPAEDCDQLQPDANITKLLDLMLTGEDLDENANITLEIDWAETEARKDQIPVPISAYDYTKCLTIVMEDGSSESVAGRIRPTSDFIDREEVDQLSLVIKVIDKATDSGYIQFDSITLVVEISDLDDTAPYFLISDPSGFSVFEINPFDSSFVPDEIELNQRIDVNDLDESDAYYFNLTDMNSAGDRGYLIFKDKDPETPQGILLVHKIIDREDQLIIENNGYLNYTVTVTDGNGNINTAEIAVLVKDINDNPPVFDNSSYSIELYEDTPSRNTTGLIVSATDNDFDEDYRKVSYLPISDLYPFWIDPDSGEIFVCSQVENYNCVGNDTETPLDYDGDDKSYTFNVVATDDQNSDVVQVTIDLKDVNDNAPTLDAGFQSLDVANTISSPGYIETLQGTDLDGEGPNSEISFFLIDDPSNTFEISETGVLSSIVSIAERTLSVNLTIELIDNGAEPLATNETCRIDIYDINDQPPVVLYPLSNEIVQISENSTAGPLRNLDGVPVVISASDDDGDMDYSTVNFELSGNNDATVIEYFEIEPNGIINLKKDFPYPEPEDDIITVLVIVFDDPPLSNDNEDQHSFEHTMQFKTSRNFPPEFANRTFEITLIEEQTGQPQQLPLATDENIDDSGSAGSDQEICYYFVDDAFYEYFNLTKKTNELRVIKGLDREENATLSVDIFASNNCVTDPSEEILPASILTVNITLTDINDNVAEFVRDDIYEGFSVDEAETWQVIEEIIDPDENQDFTCEIVSDIVPNPGNTGLDDIGVEEPFIVRSELQVCVITAGFSPTADMSGYFLFDLQVTDSAPEATHSSISNVKIVMVGLDNKVILTFNEPVTTVDVKQTQIKEVFERNFEGWIFDEDSTKQNDQQQAVVDCHFLDEDNFDPILSAQAQARYDLVYSSLIRDLEEIGLTLDSENGFDTGTGIDLSIQNESALSNLEIVLIILISVVGIMFAFLIITYWIRVDNLERKNRALGATTFGSNDSGLNRIGIMAGDAMPGTNVHAAEGANPIWNIEDDKELYNPAVTNANNTSNPLNLNPSGLNPLYKDDRKDFDESSDSGDSVLIGVEDGDAFKSRKGQQHQQFEVDADDLSDDDLDDEDDVDNLYPPIHEGFDSEGNRKMSIFLQPALDDHSPYASNSGGGGGNPLYMSDEEA